MARILPVVFDWKELQVVDPEDGTIRKIEAMVPQVRYASVAHRQYHHDAEYPMVVEEARSMKSHNAYFAQIHSGYENLPEAICNRWPTEQHFRKWLLVETGWFDEKEFEFEGVNANRDARRLAAFIRTEDEYARILVHTVKDRHVKVIVRRAKSQSLPAMSKQEFEDSKRDVLAELEHMTAVPAGTLKREAGRSA